MLVMVMVSDLFSVCFCVRYVGISVSKTER